MSGWGQLKLMSETRAYVNEQVQWSLEIRELLNFKVFRILGNSLICRFRGLGQGKFPVEKFSYLECHFQKQRSFMLQLQLSWMICKSLIVAQKITHKSLAHCL